MNNQMPQEIAQRLVWRAEKDGVKRIKPLQNHCEDCGITLTSNRTVHIKLNSQPVSHWRKMCSECRLCEHPHTGEYTITSNDLRLLLAETKNNQEIHKKDK
jgi:RNase P subunit RPR2